MLKMMCKNRDAVEKFGSERQEDLISAGGILEKIDALIGEADDASGPLQNVDLYLRDISEALGAGEKKYARDIFESLQGELKELVESVEGLVGSV